MRVLVCPQEFKGSLTAAQAADAIAAGIRAAGPTVELAVVPLADGGPGTVDVVTAAAHGRVLETPVQGPLGDAIRARYGLLASPTGDAHPASVAVLEAAAAAGLVLVPAARRDPARASTHGVGEQIRAALDAGASELIVGVGGTGTNDGGAGAAAALGYGLLDASGQPLDPGPLALRHLERIDRTAVEPRLAQTRVRIAVDVRNTLLGRAGATAVYGPQKGVTAELRSEIERGLQRWAMVVRRDLGVSIADIEGGGAGGGLAAGLVAITGGTIESGAELVASLVGLMAAIRNADVVVTGEGSLDAQTAFGKTVAYVAAQAASAGRPCLVVAGRIESIPPGVIDAEPATRPGEPVEVAITHAAERVQAAATRLIGRYISGH